PLDVVCVPQSLEDAVREAQAEEVQHRRLAEEVVDPMDVLLRDELQQLAVERLGALQVGAERLLQAEDRALRQVHVAERGAGRDSDPRRQCEVQRRRAVGFLQDAAEVIRVCHVCLQVVRRGGDCGGSGASRLACLERRGHPLSPGRIRHLVLSNTEQLQVTPAPTVEKFTESGKQQPLGEVSARAENNEGSYAISHLCRITVTLEGWL